MSNQKEQQANKQSKGEEKLVHCQHKDCVTRTADKDHQPDLQNLVPSRSDSTSPYQKWLSISFIEQHRKHKQC